MAKSSPVTKHKQLGSAFGDPLESLDPNEIPKKREIIRHWMCIFELERGDAYHMKDKQKQSVKRKVRLLMKSQLFLECQKKFGAIVLKVLT